MLCYSHNDEIFVEETTSNQNTCKAFEVDSMSHTKNFEFLLLIFDLSGNAKCLPVLAAVFCLSIRGQGFFMSRPGPRKGCQSPFWPIHPTCK